MPVSAASDLDMETWRRLGEALRSRADLAAAARELLGHYRRGFEAPARAERHERTLGRFLLDARRLAADEAARQLGSAQPLLERLGLLEGDGERRLRGVRLLPLGAGWVVVPLAAPADAPPPWTDLNYGEDTHMMLERLAGHELRAAEVLDVGTGPGVLAALCALRGARATAIDVDPKAVRAATCNRALAAADFVVEEARIERYRTSRRYDLVLFNSPFLPLLPGGRLPVCGDGGPDGMTVVRAFLRRLPDLLRPDGTALVTIRVETPARLAGPDLDPLARLLPPGWSTSFESLDSRPLIEDLFMLCAKELGPNERQSVFERLLSERDVRGWTHYGILEVRP